MRFVLLDKILHLEPGKRILASRYVSPDDDYFADHFPGYPIVPGVLQVEMIAQAIGKCLMSAVDATRWPVMLQIRQANFRKTIGPGTHLLVEGMVETCNQATAVGKGSIRIGEERVAEASVLFGFVTKNLLQEGFEDEVLQAFLAEKARS